MRLDELQKYSTRDKVALIIQKMIRSRSSSGKAINNGWCMGFARALQERLGPEATVEGSFDWPGTFPGHYWVKFKGYHYDAESPRGEREPRLMTYHSRLRALADGTNDETV